MAAGHMLPDGNNASTLPIETRNGTPKKDTMGRLQVEIASANSRAEIGPKTPPEEEILTQAIILRTLSREGPPLSARKAATRAAGGATPMASASDVPGQSASSTSAAPSAPPVIANPAAPQVSARGKSPLAAAAELACRPVPLAQAPSMVIGSPLRHDLAADGVQQPGPAAAISPRPVSQHAIEAAAAAPARPLWLGVARRLPAESRVAVGDASGAEALPYSRLAAAAVAFPGVGSRRPSATPSVGVASRRPSGAASPSAERCKVELTELRRQHDEQLSELQSRLRLECGQLQELQQENQRLNRGISEARCQGPEMEELRAHLCNFREEQDHAAVRSRELHSQLTCCEVSLQRCRVEEVALQERATAAEESCSEVAIQLQKQRLAREELRSELEDSERSREASARELQAESSHRSQAMEELQMYRSLLTQCRFRLADLEKERESWIRGVACQLHQEEDEALRAVRGSGCMSGVPMASAARAGIRTPHFMLSPVESPTPFLEGCSSEPAAGPSDASAQHMAVLRAEVDTLRRENAALRLRRADDVQEDLRQRLADAAAAASAEEQERWDVFCQTLLGPLQQRTVLLAGQCREEHLAHQAAARDARYWCEEAKACEAEAAWRGNKVAMLERQLAALHAENAHPSAPDKQASSSTPSNT